MVYMVTGKNFVFILILYKIRCLVHPIILSLSYTTGYSSRIIDEIDVYVRQF